MELQKTVATIEKRYEEDKTRRERWKRWREIYQGKFWKDGTAEHLSRIDSGKLFSTVSQLAPLMTDNKPVWSLTARDPIFQPIIEQWAKAVEYVWDILDMSAKINDSYQDALLMEQGCLQVEYDEDENEVEVTVVDPRHLVFAPGDYDDIEDCPWVCKRKAYTLGDVRRTYPDKADKLVADTTDPENKDELLGNSSSWVTVYELWIRDDTVEEDLETDNNPKKDTKVKRKLKYPNGRFVIFTKTGEGGKPVLLDDYHSPYQHGKPPYVMIYDYRVSHSIWGIGEGLHLMPIVDELNSTLQSIASKLRNNCRPNYVIDEEQLDKNEVEQTLHQGNQIWTKLTPNPNDQRFTGLELVPQAPPLQSEYQFVALLHEISEELTSVTAITKGQSAKRERQTAHEYSGMYEAAHTRTRLRVRNLERSIKKILEMILLLAMHNYNRDRSFVVEDGDTIEYRRISNTRERAAKIISDNVDQQFDIMEEEDDDRVPAMFGQENREEAKKTALQQLLSVLPIEQNKVIARFHLTMQSQSTLPTDMQSRANLALRLAQLGILDAEATLERLNWPNYKEIIARMEEKALAAAQAQGQIVGPDAAGYGEEAGIAPPADETQFQ